jgi:hypothetical protein
MGLLPRDDIGKDRRKDFSSQLDGPWGKMRHLRGLRGPAKWVIVGYAIAQVVHRGQERRQCVRGCI